MARCRVLETENKKELINPQLEKASRYLRDKTKVGHRNSCGWLQRFTQIGEVRITK